MTEPRPIFDPAQWCAAWLWQGRSISHSEQVDAPLAIYVGCDTAREVELCKYYPRIKRASLHREAVRHLWRGNSAEARRVYKSLKTCLAMAVGIVDALLWLDDVIAKIDELAPAPKPRGPYKKQSAA